MPSKLASLNRQGLTPGLPKFVPDNIHLEAIVGSHAYGINTLGSDVDVYGFYIPPKHIVFPHLAGLIHGFDNVKPLKPWNKAGVKAQNGTEYDFAMYPIVNFFRLCLDNNPNMVDVLFVIELSELTMAAKRAAMTAPLKPAGTKVLSSQG